MPKIVTTELIAEAERLLAETLPDGRARWLIPEVAKKTGLGHTTVRAIHKKIPTTKRARRRGPIPKEPEPEPIYQPVGPKPPPLKPRRFRRCPTCGHLVSASTPCFECSIEREKEIKRETRRTAASTHLSKP